MTHDRPRHRVQRPQSVLDRRARGHDPGRRELGHLQHAARRHSRPVRRSGDRLHAVGRPQPRHHRGPGHLPDRHPVALGAARQGGAGQLVLRLLADLRDLRGRHRPLLGPEPGAGIHERDGRQAALRRRAQLGPDATGVGWGLEYVLIDRTGQHNLAELRTFQDWHVQYQLRAVPGVAEVAAVARTSSSTR